MSMINIIIIIYDRILQGFKIFISGHLGYSLHTNTNNKKPKISLIFVSIQCQTETYCNSKHLSCEMNV